MTANVIFIMADDLGYWALGCNGNKEIRTPNIDSLARQGMNFSNFFCVSPVCSPARASVLTGRIPSCHGVHDYLDLAEPIAPGMRETEYLRHVDGYTDVLAANGYECALSGKWHLGNYTVAQKGFSYWRPYVRSCGNYYNSEYVKDGEYYRDPRYSTEVITDYALDFLQFRDSSKPFYLSVHYNAPHSPWGRECHVEKTFDYYYNDCPFDSVPDHAGAPDWVRKFRISCETPDVRRQVLSGYYAAVDEMDRNIGKILDYLDRNNLRENTLICFTSDNGMNMGHHGLFGKGNASWPMNMFEESVKVPFIISQPGRIAENSKCEEMFSHYDFRPTLLDYLDLSDLPGDRKPGSSFTSLLKGGNLKGRDCVVVHSEYGPVRMIRSKRWKLICRNLCGPDELYDLQSDPGETVNLAGRREISETEKRLREDMQKWFADYCDEVNDGFGLPVSGSGQRFPVKTDIPNNEKFNQDIIPENVNPR